jgi:hypothetical protein
LRRVREPLLELTVPLWLLIHPDLRKVTRVRAVIDFLAWRLAELRTLFDGSSISPADC